MADDTVVGGAGRRAGYGDDDGYRAERVRTSAAEAEALARPGLLRRISWGAVLAGAVIAFAIQFLLGLLGVAISGFGLNPANPDGLGDWGAGVAIYTVITQLVSLVAGGFVAARLAGIPKNTTSLIHGALVWGVVTLASLYLASSAVGTAVGGATSAVAALGKASGNAVEAVIPDDLSALPTPDLELAALPQDVRAALRRNDITAQNLRREVRDIYRDTISRQEQQRVANIATRTARNVVTSPGDATADIEGAIDRIIGQGGVISDQERNQLRASVADQLGISNQRAERIVQQVESAAGEAATNLEQAVETAQAEAVELADEAANTAGKVALGLFFASLFGLLAAVAGGLAGEPKHALVQDDVPLS